MRSRGGIALLVLTLAIGWSPAHAGDPEPTAAAFLDIDVNARSAAMGGTGMAVPGGLSSIYSNPAGLAGVSGQGAGILHAKWFGGFSLEWAGYATAMGQDGGAGVAATFLRSEPQERLNEFGDVEGEFTAYDAAVSVGYGRRLWGRAAAGVALKGIHEKIDDISGTGVALDLGLSADMGPAVLTATAINIGPEIDLGGDSFPLSTALAIGGSAPLLGDRILVAGAATFPAHYYYDLRLGAEVRPSRVLALRTGYRRVLDEGSDDPLSGFTYGAGFLISTLRVDYAYQPFDELGDTHRVGVSIAFDLGSRRYPSSGGDLTEAQAGADRPQETAPEIVPDPASQSSAVPAAVTTTAATPVSAPQASTEGSTTTTETAPKSAATTQTAPARTGKAAAPEASKSATRAEQPATKQAAEREGKPVVEEKKPAETFAGPALVVAGTHGTRFSALEELRLLRLSGFRGGEVRRLADGRFQVVAKRFDKAADARAWISGEARKYGNLNFQVIAAS